MLRALAVVALLAGVASAEDEDPKAAIASRGVVLKAGKRHVIVFVPPATKEKYDEPTSRFFRGTFYFGDSKTLYKVPSGSWRDEGNNSERMDLVDPREVFSAKLLRNGETFSLQCADFDERTETKRSIALTVADAKTTALAAKTPHRSLNILYAMYLFLRVPNTTQYLYVDRNREPNSQEFRLFMGKRGAMKKVAVKEVALDTNGLILVTAKGTLTFKAAQTKDAQGTATFGPTKKPEALEVIPAWPNRKLIHSELGVYTRDRTGYPCDEL